MGEVDSEEGIGKSYGDVSGDLVGWWKGGVGEDVDYEDGVDGD